jgi:hypothetical protein
MDGLGGACEKANVVATTWTYMADEETIDVFADTNS